MISQHTPGPWETLTFSNHELQTDFAMVKIGSRVHMVGYSDEDKANACLIAAAPDLLHACRKAVLVLAALSETCPPLIQEYEIVSAAIAKATQGETK
jgi:hypothetical protein